MRTFIAIEIPVDIRKDIDLLITGLKEYNLPIKWVTFRNLHITLRFLGEIDESKKTSIDAIIQQVGSRHTQFPVGLKGIGCFPGPKDPRVVWIGVEEGAHMMGAIAEELEEALSKLHFKRETRFHAHLTIGRVKKSCAIEAILAKDFIARQFLAESITLFKSTLKPEGPVYEVLNRYNLKKMS